MEDGSLKTSLTSQGLNENISLNPNLTLFQQLVIASHHTHGVEILDEDTLSTAHSHAHQNPFLQSPTSMLAHLKPRPSILHYLRPIFLTASSKPPGCGDLVSGETHIAKLKNQARNFPVRLEWILLVVD
jgi:hypothetical protein